MECPATVPEIGGFSHFGKKKTAYYGHAMSVQKGIFSARILPGSGKTLQKI